MVPSSKLRRYLPLILFLLTCFTTLLAGAMQRGIPPEAVFSHPGLLLPAYPPLPAYPHPEATLKALPTRDDGKAFARAGSARSCSTRRDSLVAPL